MVRECAGNGREGNASLTVHIQPQRKQASKKRNVPLRLAHSDLPSKKPCPQSHMPSKPTTISTPSPHSQSATTGTHDLPPTTTTFTRSTIIFLRYHVIYITLSSHFVISHPTNFHISRFTTPPTLTLILTVTLATTYTHLTRAASYGSPKRSRVSHGHR